MNCKKTPKKIKRVDPNRVPSYLTGKQRVHRIHWDRQVQIEYGMVGKGIIPGL